MRCSTVTKQECDVAIERRLWKAMTELLQNLNVKAIQKEAWECLIQHLQSIYEFHMVIAAVKVTVDNFCHVKPDWAVVFILTLKIAFVWVVVLKVVFPQQSFL